MRFTCPKCKTKFIVSKEWWRESSMIKFGRLWIRKCPNKCIITVQYTFEMFAKSGEQSNALHAEQKQSNAKTSRQQELDASPAPAYLKSDMKLEGIE